jgi:single-strand DNA-binding protein
MFMNDIKLAGYVGKTPELRYLPSGTPVTSFRLGHSYSYTDQTSKKVEKTNWFTVVAYGPVADIAKRFATGDNVVLDGQLEQREWQGQDGHKRSVYEVIARNVAKLEKTGERNGAPEQGDESNDEAPWPTVSKK